MLIALSPAKTLDFDSPLPEVATTQPRFVAEAAALVDILRPMAPHQLASLMSISDKLATLNADRFAAWVPRFDKDNSRPAVLAFAGDVYEGLAAPTLAPDDLAWVQDHVAILSGLYGMLRPLDLMQPYRLEMGTKLANPRGRDLYAWWGDRIATALRERLERSRHPVLVNLASEEYFGAVDLEALGARVIQPVFQEDSGKGYRVVSFHAKRARGLMTRWAAEQRLDDPEGLKGFDLEGYAWAPAASSPDKWLFRRRAPAKSML